MAEWAVELKGDKFDLEELPKEFCSPDLLVVREGDRYLLRSETFAGYSSENDIYSRAVILLERLNGTMKIKMRNFINVDIETLIYTDEQGVPHRHYRLKVDSGHIRMKAGSVSLMISPSGETASPGTPKSSSVYSTTWAKVADTDANASKVLRLFGQELNWMNLYKISEVIYEDQGKGIIDKNWASQDEVNNFRATANSYGAIGDQARHATERNLTPAKPMTLGEAQALIRSIADMWLQERASILKAP